MPLCVSPMKTLSAIALAALVWPALAPPAAAQSVSVSVGGSASISSGSTVIAGTAVDRPVASFRGSWIRLDRHPLYHPYYGKYSVYERYPRYSGIVPIGPEFADASEGTAIALLRLGRETDPGLLDPSYRPGAEADGSDPDPATTAMDLMRSGHYADAALVYEQLASDEERAHPAGSGASTPRSTPRTMTRLHGFALAAAGEFQEAGAALAKAYREDPSLASSPLRGALFVPDEGRLRRIAQRASAYASGAETHDAWLTVAVVMHAEGRHGLANEFARRAAAAKPPEVPDDATTHTDLPDPPAGRTADAGGVATADEAAAGVAS